MATAGALFTVSIILHRFATSSKQLRVEFLEAREDDNDKVMTRNDSEYSLGLNRSTSLHDKLNEFGLCEEGQILVTLGRLTVYSVITVYTGHYVGGLFKNTK
jgi:hypothetical protein